MRFIGAINIKPQKIVHFKHRLKDTPSCNLVTCLISSRDED